MAGNIAFKFKKQNLHTSDENENVQPTESFLTRSVRNGLILTPSSEWLKDVKSMYQLFLDYHPENSLRKGPGLVANFTKVLIEKFPNRDPKVLEEFAKIRTFSQIRAINAKVREKKNSVRAMKNLVRTIHS